MASLLHARAPYDEAVGKVVNLLRCLIGAAHTASTSAIGATVSIPGKGDVDISDGMLDLYECDRNFSRVVELLWRSHFPAEALSLRRVCMAQLLVVFAMTKREKGRPMDESISPTLASLWLTTCLLLDTECRSRAGHRVNMGQVVATRPQGSKRSLRLDPQVRAHLAGIKKRKATLETWSTDTGAPVLGNVTYRLNQEIVLRHHDKMRLEFAQVDCMNYM